MSTYTRGRLVFSGTLFVLSVVFGLLNLSRGNTWGAVAGLVGACCTAFSAYVVVTDSKRAS